MSQIQVIRDAMKNTIRDSELLERLTVEWCGDEDYAFEVPLEHCLIMLRNERDQLKAKLASNEEREVRLRTELADANSELRVELDKTRADRDEARIELAEMKEQRDIVKVKLPPALQPAPPQFREGWEAGYARGRADEKALQEERIEWLRSHAAPKSLTKPSAKAVLQDARSHYPPTEIHGVQRWSIADLVNFLMVAGLIDA